MRNHRHAHAVVAPSIRSIGLVIVVGAGLVFGVGCQKGTTNDKPAAGSSAAVGATVGSGSAGSGGSAAPATPAVEPKDIDSKDILARAEPAAEVQVKHVLLGWKDLAPIYGGRLHPRAGKRSNDETAALAQEIAAKLKANPDQIDAVIKESSEDPG